MTVSVALVDDQLNVTDSPLLMAVGFAVSVTVGRAAGAGAGGGSWLTTGFFPQPTVRAAAAKAHNIEARYILRYNGRATSVMRNILLDKVKSPVGLYFSSNIIVTLHSFR